MFKKLLPWYLLALVVLSLAFIYGCGNATGGGGGGGGGGSSTNYTISGNCPQAQITEYSNPHILVTQKHITRIVAIGSNGNTYSTTPGSDGSFSLGLVKGVPYVLGFYSGTNGTTLEGYLTVPSLGWQSLPIFDPSGSSADLGTLTVEAGTLEVIPSITAAALEALMQMTSEASFYGAIDDAMLNYLNIDVNKDGIPDYQQNKSLYLRLFEMGGPGPDEITSGEIPAMLGANNYNDSYVPCPIGYQFALAGGNAQTDKTHATLLAPLPDLSDGTSSYNTLNASVEITGDWWWIFFRSPNDNLNTGPNTPPSGTYVATIESTSPQTYVFDNCSFSGAYTLGSTDNIVYPVLNLETAEGSISTEITTVNYKWMKSSGGFAVAATPQEVNAAVGNYSIGSLVSDISPHIQFFGYSWDSLYGYYYLDRDNTSLDLTAYHIPLSAIGHIKVAYTSAANVQAQFRYGK